MRKGGLSMLLTGLLITAMAPAADGDNGRRFQAKLRGNREVPPVDTAAKGSAAFTFNKNLTRLRYRVEFQEGGRTVGVSLHCAPAGAIGPVVADLLGAVAGGLGGKVAVAATLASANILPDAGCASVIGRSVGSIADLAEAMRLGAIYVNVRSTDFADGEVRGQVKKEVTVSPPPQASPPGDGTVITATSTAPSLALTVPIQVVTPFSPSVQPAASSFALPATNLTIPVSLSPIASSNFTFATASLSIPPANFGFSQGFSTIAPATLTLPPLPFASSSATVQIFPAQLSLPLALSSSFSSTASPVSAVLSLPSSTFTLPASSVILPAMTLTVPSSF
jgi:hypothetical protein